MLTIGMPILKFRHILKRMERHFWCDRGLLIVYDRLLKAYKKCNPPFPPTSSLVHLYSVLLLFCPFVCRGRKNMPNLTMNLLVFFPRWPSFLLFTFCSLRSVYVLYKRAFWTLIVFANVLVHSFEPALRTKATSTLFLVRFDRLSFQLYVYDTFCKFLLCSLTNC